MNTYNLGHNILELYNVLVKIRLTTSKTKRDIQYSKLGIRVTSRIAEQLGSQEIRKYQENFKFGCSLVPPHFQNLNLDNSSQKTSKSRYRTFLDLSSFTGFLRAASSIPPRIVDACQNCAKLDGSSQTKCKVLSLSKNKEFVINYLKASCSSFAEFTKNIAQYQRMNGKRSVFP